MPCSHLQLRKGAFQGAFFVFSLITSELALSRCTGPELDAEPARVQFVSDGDSLILSDQRRIRLIGINTPEMQRHGQANQALAILARDRLRQLLFKHHNRIKIQLGAQTQDRHGRWLAHLYLPNNNNISEQLIREGLGWVVAIAPNLSQADCLKIAEQEARQSQRGIWAVSQYTPVETTKLKLRDRGFKHVQGKIQQVVDRTTARWITLAGRFTIRIPKSALATFKQPPTQTWVGRSISVRGWLYTHQGKLHMNLEHPAAMDIIDF